MKSPLLIVRLGGLTRLTLDRPDKANALDAELVEALLAAVATAHHDGTRLLTLQGEGRNFSAGFDFSGFDSASEGDLLHRFVRIEQLLQMIHHAPFGTLALAHGKNFGAGADLFLVANMRIAAPGSSYRMPGFRFGLQLGTRRLAARVGSERARAMLTDSRTIAADQALAWNFASAIVEPAAWQATIESELERVSVLAPEAIERLHSATLTDTRHQDMADLVMSAAAPGLKQRIAAFRSGA